MTKSYFTVTAIACVALAACSKPAPAPEATESAAAPSEAAAAAPMTVASLVGKYAVSDAAGKAVDTTEIRADGGYTETPAAGGLAKSGVVTVVDGKSCFDPSGKEEATCFTHGPTAADGTFTVTDPKGVVLTVKPIK